jgi:mono/diheme cytochrome c family protein
MLMGAGGVSFDLPFEVENTHGIVVPDSCASCHMADGIGEPGELNPPLVGLHTFAMRDPENNAINADNACATCHSGLDTYDRTAGGDYDGNGLVQGVQTEVEGLLTIMRSGILSTMPGTSATAGGYINITSGGFNALAQQQKQALYNYNFVAKDGSRGVHNTSYAVQLLQRSYYGVFGKPITQDYPNIDLRGPVQDIPESSSVIFIN